MKVRMKEQERVPVKTGVSLGRKPYQRPQIVHELALETRAGSALQIILGLDEFGEVGLD